jgi:hypothetical protein
MQLFERTTYRSIQGYIALNNNSNVCSSVGLAPQELLNSVHIGRLKFSLSAGFADIVREFYKVALNSQIMLAVHTTLAQSGIDAFYDNAVGIGFATEITQALWKQIQNSGGSAKFTPAHFIAWKLWCSPQMLQILATDCADKLRGELRKRIANSTTPLVGLANDPSVINLPNAIRAVVSKLILAAFTGTDIDQIVGNDFTIDANKTKIITRPEPTKLAIPISQQQTIPIIASNSQRQTIPIIASKTQQSNCDAIFPRRITQVINKK